jgi:hypothetical protein
MIAARPAVIFGFAASGKSSRTPLVDGNGERHFQRCRLYQSRQGREPAGSAASAGIGEWVRSLSLRSQSEPTSSASTLVWFGGRQSRLNGDTHEMFDRVANALPMAMAICFAWFSCFATFVPAPALISMRRGFKIGLVQLSARLHQKQK